MSSIVIFLFVLCTSIGTCSDSCAQIPLYPAHTGKTLKGHVLETLKVPSISRCVHRCEKNMNCLSFNFDSDTKECEINSKDSLIASGDLVATSRNVIFSDIKDWLWATNKQCKGIQCLAGERCDGDAGVCIIPDTTSPLETTARNLWTPTTESPQQTVDYPAATTRPRRETEVKTSLAPVVEGAMGVWSSAVYCPLGEYATGYKMQIWSDTSNPSDTIAGGLDESGVNAVILTCARPLSDFTSYIGPIPGTGTVGEWSEYAMCPLETFIVGFWLQISEDLGDDDSSVIWLGIKCRALYEDGDSTRIHVPTQYRQHGNYRIQSELCDVGSAVCGIYVRAVEPQGAGDDTGLNNVEMLCCDAVVERAMKLE